jgi:hypothetical protein
MSDDSNTVNFHIPDSRRTSAAPGSSGAAAAPPSGQPIKPLLVSSGQDTNTGTRPNSICGWQKSTVAIVAIVAFLIAAGAIIGAGLGSYEAGRKSVDSGASSKASTNTNPPPPTQPYVPPSTLCNTTASASSRPLYSLLLSSEPAVQTVQGPCRAPAEPGRLQTCVRPYGVVEFAISVINKGSVTWGPDVTLSLVNKFDGFQYWNTSNRDAASQSSVSHLLNPTPLKPLTLVQPKVAPDATGVFVGLLPAPAFIGVFDITWQASGACGIFPDTTIVKTLVEVTCSDGIFCNGMERFINGRCKSAPRGQCDDGYNCTMDDCNEEFQLCTHYVPSDATNCASCFAGDACVAYCPPNAQCGFDGCGGSCGAGGACGNHLACSNYTCVIPNSLGSCSNPIPLLGSGESLLGYHRIEVDTSLGVNEVTPFCNAASTATEMIYKFEVPASLAPVGIDARLGDYTHDLDTVLILRKDRCIDPDDTFSFQADGSDEWCSDDATPPGGLGSRINALLPAGIYYLIADGYSTLTVGPANLTVKFVSGYVPQCLSRFCGDDGHGGDCGPCEADQKCNPFKRCVPKECKVEKCLNGTAICGDDGCGFGGTCGKLNGACPGDLLCVQERGTCESFRQCNHMLPTCSPSCGPSQFCALNCTCLSIDDALPDVYFDPTVLANSVTFDTSVITAKFDNTSCAFGEQCIMGLGQRKLMRFDAYIVNQGNGPLQLLPPKENPQEFAFATCHNHYHYKGFAEYRLLDKTGTQVVRRGHKQAYCLEDSGQMLPQASTAADIAAGVKPYSMVKFRDAALNKDVEVVIGTQVGPDVPCVGSTDCDKPGLSRGFYDVYGRDLDCQWIDITDIPAGEYLLRVESNSERALVESTTENNVAVITVTIP